MGQIIQLTHESHSNKCLQFIIRMQSVKKSLHLAKKALIEKHHQSVQVLFDCLHQEDTAPSFGKDTEKNEIIEKSNNLLGKDEEKVLEIDVIQSNYIPRTQEEIKEPTQSEPTESLKINQSRKEKKNLDEIQKQKKAILEQLRKIDEQIAIIKGEPAQDINLRRKEKEIEQEKARKQAKDLVRQLKREKKELEQRKRKEHEKQLLALKQQEEEIRQRRRQEQSRQKEQRRKAIQQRMQDERKKRQQRKLMDKQSNKLLMQLKRQDQLLKFKESIPAEITEVQQKKKVVQKRQDVNFREIEEHQRRYIIMKEQEKMSRRDRSQSLSHPIPKYQKNTWIEKIEEEQFKKKEEEKMKQLQRKNQLQKRLKYGELVKNIFLPKKKEESKISNEQVSKPHTPNAPVLPKIPESEKRVTDTRANNHFKQQNRPFATAHNYKKPPRAPKQPKQEKEQAEPEIKQVDLQKEKQRKQRQLQLRRQTKERLRKLENQSLDLLPQSKPKYQNYLNQVKQKRKDDLNWKQIIENGKLSKQQKYTEMLKKANNLETRAKQKEEFRKDGDEEAVNLYIGSIQAKLALLEKF